MKTIFRTLGIAILLIWTGITIAQENGAMPYKETIKIPDQFDGIEVSSVYNVTLISGSEQLVLAESDQPINGKIAASVHGGTLELEVDGVPASKVKFYVTFLKLTKIEATGACTIKGDNTITSDKFQLEASGASKVDLKLDVKNLNSEITGASKVKYSGKSEYHNLEISGASKLSAFELETSKANVEVTGAAVARLNVKNEVSGEASGAAKLLFNSEPAIRNINTSGVSKIYSGDSLIVKTEEVEKIIVGDKVMTIGKDGVVIESDSAGSESMVINDDGVKMIIKEKNTGDQTQKEVIVINKDGVKIVQKDGVTEKHLLKKKGGKYDGHWDGFELGVSGYLNADNKMTMPKGFEDFDLKLEKSINVRLNFMEQNINLIGNHLGLTTGLGLDFVNYRFADNVRLSPDSLSYTFAYQDKTPGTSYKKSKLVVSYLVLPLFLEYQTNNKDNLRSFHIAAGMEFGLRIGSHTKVMYNNGQDQRDKERDNYNLNPFKYDATVRIGWAKLNLYGTYAMNELFKTDKGPQLYPFSIGVSFTNL